MSEPHLPPLAALETIHDRLQAAGIEHALGASALLHAHGLENHVGDWDVNTDADKGTLEPLLEGLEPVFFGSSGIHADSKFQLMGGVVELIVQMAIVAERRVVRIPTILQSSWHGFPVGSCEAWAVAYALLGRVEKSERLFEKLEREGASGVAVARMLQEPLPTPLKTRLIALRVR